MSHLILAETIRREWDSTYRLKGVPRHLARDAKCWGAVTHSLLKLIEKVWSYQPGFYEHPSECFVHVFLEWEALGIFFSDPDIPTKTALIATIRAQNQALRDYTNPFTQPHTQQFFSTTIALAEQFDGFRPPLHQFIRDRRAMATHLAKNAYILESRGTALARVARGRKKSSF